MKLPNTRDSLKLIIPEWPEVNLYADKFNVAQRETIVNCDMKIQQSPAFSEWIVKQFATSENGKRYFNDDDDFSNQSAELLDRIALVILNHNGLGTEKKSIPPTPNTDSSSILPDNLASQ